MCIFGVVDEHAGKQRFEMAGVDVVQKLRVDIDLSVVQSGDFKLTELHPVKAGNLSVDHRGLGMGRRHQAQEGESAESRYARDNRKHGNSFSFKEL